MLATDIKTQLLSDIANGAIASGDRLTIDDLARRYGASHMPVREALRELLGTGLLRQGQGRSMQLATMDKSSVERLFSTRAAIEAMLARQAAQRCTKRHLAQLEEIETELERRIDIGDNQGVLAINRRFHSELYAIAENADANSIVERHWLFIGLLWARVDFGAERYAGMKNDHRHILIALEANDVEAVGVLMGAHVIKAKHELVRRMFGPNGVGA